ncbi:hypothetical protein EfmAA610_29370 [Enterococcus faecium]|nr:hypothetical protein EfmAA610_29370 [Enterococcus faecium]
MVKFRKPTMDAMIHYAVGIWGIISVLVVASLSMIGVFEKLDSLDKEAKSKFASIPNDKKMIVTSEGCFKYFSKAYNVPSAYIWEINTEEEGTPDQIKHLVEKLRTTKVPSLFVESSVDDRPMKTVSKDTNIPIYSTIFTDSIAEKGQDGDSYYAMMKWNLDKIAEGLSK